MKRILLTSVLLTIGMLVMAAMVTAGVPSLINYQGRLTNSLGNPLDTTVSITFSIYSDSVGGAAIWSETHPAVNVVKGLFTVKLGSLSPGNWDENLFIHSYPPGRFLGIKVGGNAEMTSRSMFTTSPFAVQASCVDGFNPGSQNVDSGSFTFVAGDSNTVLGDYGSIAGGVSNYVERIDADTVLDTCTPPPTMDYGTEFPSLDIMHTPLPCYWWPSSLNPAPVIVGGKDNIAKGIGSIVGAGASNSALSTHSAILGGCSNVAENQFAFVGGGFHNHASSNYSTVGGGRDNVAGVWALT